MKVKVTVLSENSVFSNIGAIAEHGWSAYIETEHGNYLFDTGQGKALLNNARVFQKDLSGKMNIERLGVSHCTGFEVGARLAEQFGSKFFYCNVGTVVEI